MVSQIPCLPGSYLLWLQLARPQQVVIGRLGCCQLPSGHYFYLGSAHGPGGLQARLGRHLRGGGRPHWHVDTLRAFARVQGFGYRLSPPLTSQIPGAEAASQIPLECTWSQALANLPGTRIPAPGFGSSDCRAGCTAHLIALPDSTVGTAYIKNLFAALLDLQIESYRADDCREVPGS